MALDKLTIINNGGLSTTSDYRVGVLTATKFVGPFEGSITATDASFTGNVSIAGTLTYEDVTNVDSIGLGTFRNGLHVLTGTATTALVVDGDARVTGILTVGSSSLTLDGTNNLVNVGTALTLGHTQGLQFHTQNLHAAGFEINNVNASGIITASQFVGDGSNLSNTGSTLSEPSTGTQRIVTTSLTSGTMTSSGTGSELAFDYANNELEFSNNTKSVFGDNGDLEIFFDGTHSKIDHTPTSGSLFLAGDSLVLSNSGMSQYYLQAAENGAVSLNYSGSTKLATTNTGISITGQGVFSSAITASTYIQGTSSNGGLKFYSDSSTSKGVVLNTDDHLVPTHDSNSDLGLTGTRWRNVYADTLYGDGSNLTGITQTTINSNTNNYLITGTGTANTLQGEANLTFNGSNLTVNTNDNQKIILSGTTNPYIRFQENSTNKALIGWHSEGYFKITNNEDSSELRIKDTLQFTTDMSTYYTVWHSGNDGSGSGLDADSLDGIGSGGFLRSNVSDTCDANLSFSQDGQNGFLTTPGGTIFHNVGGSSSKKLVLRNLAELRFQDAADWNYNEWAGIKFVTSTDTMYIGGPASSNFTNNGGAANIDVNFVGLNANGLKKDGNTVWHAGNDGVGSGLDADLLDGYSGGSYLRSDANDVCSGRIQFTKNSEANYDTIASSSGSQGCIEIYNQGSGNDAFLAFHAGSDYAFYFGLDADTNDLSVGGWSMGANKYKVWHEGNDGPSSGLNADLLDGLQRTGFVEHNQNSGYILKFGSGGNTGYSSSSYPYAIFQEGGAWSGTYPDLRINHHTGIIIAVGHQSYKGLRFQRDYNDATELMSIGDGDSHVRIANDLYIGGHKALTVNDAISNADTVDNVHASSFLRNDTDNNVSNHDVQVRFYSDNSIHTTSSYQASLEVYNPNSGSDAFMSFHVSGDYAFYLGLDGGINDLAVGGWSMGNNRYRVWHEGNDGSGSGLDADKVDGLHIHTGTNNEANKLVRTDGNGYIQAGWLNTPSGDTGTGSDCKFYASQDNYIRYIDLKSMRSVMNVSARSSAFSGREDQTTDQNYWIGSAGWGAANFDTTVWDYGSCFYDVWSNPSGQPSTETSHWTGMQSMHYTNGSARYGFRFACGAGNPHNAYIQGRWNTTTNGWYRLWNESNDYLLFSTTHNQTDQLVLKSHTNSWSGGIKFISNNGSNVAQLHMDNDTNYDLMVDSSFYVGGNFRCNGNVIPHSNDNKDLGTSSLRWRNVYTTDLQLSNESKKDKGGNDVDGTWGDYTIQEGEDDLFLINNRNGKKYKFMVQEVK